MKIHKTDPNRGKGSAVDIKKQKKHLTDGLTIIAKKNVYFHLQLAYAEHKNLPSMIANRWVNKCISKVIYIKNIFRRRKGENLKIFEHIFRVFKKTF